TGGGAGQGGDPVLDPRRRASRVAALLQHRRGCGRAAQRPPPPSGAARHQRRLERVRGGRSAVALPGATVYKERTEFRSSTKEEEVDRKDGKAKDSRPHRHGRRGTGGVRRN